MKYKCAGCGSADSRHDWVNSQFGEYYCPDCLEDGRAGSRMRQQKRSAPPLVVGLAFFLVTVFGLAGLLAYIFP